MDAVLFSRAALAVGSAALALVLAGGWFLLHLIEQIGRLILRVEALEQRSASVDAEPPPVAGRVPATHPGDTPVVAPEATDIPGPEAPRDQDGRVNGRVPDRAAVRTVVPRTAVGQPAPEVRLPDLHGRVVSLADFRGSRTLVLLWNPGCGFCQRMLPDLKAYELNPPPAAPKLLVVSTATLEENRAMGLRSPVILDHDFGIGSSLGAIGTPMAVLVDEEGRVASPAVAGAEAILRLAGARPEPAPPATA